MQGVQLDKLKAARVRELQRRLRRQERTTQLGLYVLVVLLGLALLGGDERLPDGVVVASFDRKGEVGSTTDVLRARYWLEHETQVTTGNHPDWLRVLVPNLLSEEEIEATLALAALAREAPAELPGDRAKGYDALHEGASSELFSTLDSLQASQALYRLRLEASLHEKRRDIWERVLGLAWLMDALYWHAWPSTDYAVRPEVEFIEHDVARFGKNSSYEQHVDNNAVVTAIIMLRQRGVDFDGGENYYSGRGPECEIGAAGTDGSTADKLDDTSVVELQRGDAIFFRGERVPHGVANVTAGRRAVLQFEFAVERSVRDKLAALEPSAEDVAWCAPHRPARQGGVLGTAAQSLAQKALSPLHDRTILGWFLP